MKKVRLITLGTIFIFLGIIFGIYKTYANEETYTFTSNIYSINDDNIYNISPNTDISLYKEYFDYTNCYITITNNKDNNYIINGSKTILYNNDNIKLKEYTNIVVGDINSDGLVDDTDLSIYSKNILKNEDRNLDLDNDNKTNLSDILLLENTINNGVVDIKLEKEEYLLQTGEQVRIISSVNPNFGINTNLDYESMDKNIATVSRSGIITGGVEGNTTIVLTSKDKNKNKEVHVKVDNTIQLEQYEGRLYVGGNPQKIYIKSIDYNDITCQSSSQAVECDIEGKYLIIKGKSQSYNKVNIDVISKNYGTVTYKADVVPTNISLAFTSVDCKAKGTRGSVIFSTTNAGKISIDIKDKEIINDAYIAADETGRKYFVYEAGKKAGLSTVSIKESNGNFEKIFTLYVYQLKFKDIGMFMEKNKTYEIDYLHEGEGNLTCSSSDEQIATCNLEGGILTVTTHAIGEAYIYLNNIITHHYNEYNVDEDHACGKANLYVVVREGE